MLKINDINNWKEVTRGLYRYVAFAKVCYEIHIMYYNLQDDISTSNAKLYLVGRWYDKDNNFFQRQELTSGTLKKCLEQAEHDYENNWE